MWVSFCILFSFCKADATCTAACDALEKLNRGTNSFIVAEFINRGGNSLIVAEIH